MKQGRSIVCHSHRRMGKAKACHPIRNQTLSDRDKSKRDKGIWQRRFWEHCIRNEVDWRQHMDYIHYNPIKHGYCATPAEWAYSSFHRLVKQGLYPIDWGSSPFSEANEMDLD